MKAKILTILVALFLFPSIAFSECEVTIDGNCVLDVEVEQYNGMMDAPSDAPANTRREYYDEINNTLMCSEDGEIYEECGLDRYDDFVPYVGATQEVDLGSKAFIAGTGTFSGSVNSANGFVDTRTTGDDIPILTVNNNTTEGLFWSQGATNTLSFLSTGNVNFGNSGGDLLQLAQRYGGGAADFTLVGNANMIVNNDMSVVGYLGDVGSFGMVGHKSIDVDSRQLYANGGTDLILDWNTSGTADFDDSNIITTGDIKYDGDFKMENEYLGDITADGTYQMMIGETGNNHITGRLEILWRSPNREQIMVAYISAMPYDNDPQISLVSNNDYGDQEVMTDLRVGGLTTDASKRYILVDVANRNGTGSFAVRFSGARGEIALSGTTDSDSVKTSVSPIEVEVDGDVNMPKLMINRTTSSTLPLSVGGDMTVHPHQSAGHGFKIAVTDVERTTLSDNYGDIVLDPLENVGIKTDTPSYDLHVAGTVGIDTSLEVPEIADSLGDLKIQPDSTGGVVLFGDSDVGDTTDGEDFTLYRKAAEGDSFMRKYIDQYGQSFMASSSFGGYGLFFRNNGAIYINDSAAGNVELFGSTDVGDDNDGKRFRVWRKAAEGDTDIYFQGMKDKELDMVVTGGNLNMWIPNGAFRFSANGYFSIQENPKTDVRFFSFVTDSTKDAAIIKKYGWITASGTRKYIQEQVSDTSDMYEITREDANILGMDIQMPLFTDAITASDNVITSGSVTATDYVFKGKALHAYGGFQDAATTITIGASNTWYHITNATNDLWTGTEADGITISGDVMTLARAGDYRGLVTFDLSALTGKDYHVRVYNNTQDTVMGYKMGVSTTGAGNNVPIPLPLYLEVDAGDELQLEIECASSATDVVLDNAVFYLDFLHD